MIMIDIGRQRFARGSEPRCGSDVFPHL